MFINVNKCTGTAGDLCNLAVWPFIKILKDIYILIDRVAWDKKPPLGNIAILLHKLCI